MYNPSSASYGRSNTSYRSIKTEEPDEIDYDEVTINWSDAIFIPFHPMFKLIVLICVIHKTFLGPLRGAFKIIICTDAMDFNIITQGIKYFYTVFADGIYCLDTFLHIVHRQVTDKAVRREHLPKSALLILLDLISLIPFTDLFSTTTCARTFWPNILSFTEFIVIYRIIEYFKIVSTHSYWKLYIGYTIAILVCVNCLTCFMLLLTFEGLCANCKKTDHFHDWRKYVRKQPSISDDVAWYFHGYQYTFSYFINSIFDDTKPSTLIEIGISIFLVVVGYIYDMVLILPKLFSESMLSLRWISTFHPHVNKLIQETKRRNPSRTAYTSVHSFYNLMWNQRCGIINTPDIIHDLPRHMRIEIRQDLIWQVFYHSPTLRRTSTPFKRYLSDLIRMDYKLPGARFFVGPQSNTNVYYLKTGIVQLISADDGSTPLLSVSGGTLFGDISFITYPMKRKVYVKCLTYCEILYVTRNDLLNSLHLYPNDRKNVLQLVQEKIKHARTLYNCKQNVKGLDRSEDEGIDWLKRRWWEISDCVGSFKKKTKVGKCEIPPEETFYHCAKYLGQLVLCDESQLKKTSIFVKDKFPWVLSPNSDFIHFWQNFVNLMVIVVLLTFPPNLSRTKMPPWFLTVKYCTDFVYMADICISLCTSVNINEDDSSGFTSVMLVRLKTPSFVMDVLAALWIEYATILIGKPEYFYTCQFNRLIKIYKLLPKVGHNWSIGQDHYFPVYLKIFVSYFCFFYIISFVVFLMIRLFRILKASYFFGYVICNDPTLSNTDCILTLNNVYVVQQFLFEYMFSEGIPNGMQDICLNAFVSYHGYILAMYCKSRCIASMYLKFRERLSYQRFVTTLRNYYKRHTIHKSLMERLENYLLCHWKYHHGTEMLRQTSLKDEPYDIYWKVQGEVAEKVIGESYIFFGADPGLVRELAYGAKYLIMPQGGILIVFGVLCKNVTWLIQGTVKCEYHNERGEVMRRFYKPGDMIGITATILEKPSIRTYIAVTDCEVIHIGLVDFKKIMNKYPQEYGHLKRTMEEFAHLFDELNKKYFTRHADYQRKMRERIFASRKSIFMIQPAKPAPSAKEKQQKKTIVEFDTQLYMSPDSNFMKFWLPFRAATVVLSIVTVALIGGGGIYHQRQLSYVKTLCAAISLIDILIKLFLAYYDEKGLLVTKRSKTVTNYITRGFTLDVIGFLPWDSILGLLLEKGTLPPGSLKLINTTSQFAHLYMITGYFDYLADRPSSISVLIKIIKWQVVLLLLTFASSHFLINSCVQFTLDNDNNVIDARRRNTCWLPMYVEMSSKPTTAQFNMLFAHSINLAQDGYRVINLGKYRIRGVGNKLVPLSLLTLGLVYWFILGYSLIILVLISRTDTLFQHGVKQLNTFLLAERVETVLIKRTMDHFSYWWIRTKGLNIHKILFQRLGVILRQDLSYYFYKSTYVSLDTLLNGGEQVQRQLSGQSQQIYFLSKEPIMKEMHLMPNIFVVHRGRVVVTQNGEKLAVLTKGAIFGQLCDIKPRPMKVSVYAEGYADVLHMSVKQFDDQLNDDIRKTIKDNPDSKLDYMALKKTMPENPMNTVKYLLRGRKAIRLPWMASAKEAHRGNWYYRWLYVVWLLGPAATAYLTVLFSILPPDVYPVRIWLIFIFSDVIQLLHTISEFYNVEISIVGDKCVYRRVGTRMFRRWRVYIILLSMVLPEFQWLIHSSLFRLGRLLRLIQFYDFYKNFCKTFKSQWASVSLKFIVLTLILHSMICGWIHIGCRRDKFPVPLPVLPPSNNSTLDLLEWLSPNDRPNGCARTTRSFLDANGIRRTSFVVANHWAADYLVALLFIIILQAHGAFDAVVQLTVSEIYYKIFITFIMNLIDIWLLSVAINAVYTKFRELYQYDFNVMNLTTYLERTGLSPSLTRTVVEYFRHLWNRQKGNWLPELAHQAPHCLREDILGALYLHHIMMPALFRQLPEYFTKQLVTRVGRLVVFPGECIVQEGDISSVIYFIHEGEVEKWYNYQSPERKFVSLLSTNGYFGFLPGLFPNTPFQFTYATRTVVDLVYLRLKDWSDLLAAYPDVKVSLYKMAVQLKTKKGEEYRKAEDLLKQDLSQPIF